MKRKRTYYGRKPSQDFGAYLRKWREDVPLILDNAALKLGIKSKNPGAHLSMIERGDRAIPDAALLNVPRVYGVPAEEVLRRAYWPQLHLSLLTAIMAPTELPKAIEDYLKDLEEELEDDDKMELTRYAAFLRLRRHLVSQH